MLLKPLNYKAPTCIHAHTQTITATPSYINSNVPNFADTLHETSIQKSIKSTPDYKIYLQNI